MRKVILFLLALMSVSAAAYSQSEDIKTIIVIEETTSNTNGNRAPAKVQVECFYYSYTNCLEFLFRLNLGTVNVVLENQNTGEIQDYVANSSTGRIMLPVESDCAYRMDITIENGRSYYAVFYTGSDDFE